MLAIFENLGFLELMVVLVVALLIFGRRLPEVAGQAGSTISKLKRSIENLREETGIDREIRKAQRDIQSVIPRDLSIGEMARKASAELEKRIKANETADEATAQPGIQNGAQVVLRQPEVMVPGDILGSAATAEPSEPAGAIARTTKAPEKPQAPQAPQAIGLPPPTPNPPG